jgi:hypothetical protein
MITAAPAAATRCRHHAAAAPKPYPALFPPSLEATLVPICKGSSMKRIAAAKAAAKTAV